MTRGAALVSDPRSVPSPEVATALASAFSVIPAWTRPQLQFWFPSDSITALCRRLERLVDRGILQRRRIAAASGSGPYAYLLTRLGIQLLYGASVARPEGNAGWDLYHSLGIGAFYLALHRTLPAIDGEVLAWRGQAAAACPVEPGSPSYVNPDAAFLVAHDWEQWFLFEYDRSPSSAGITQFVNKLTRYLRYYDTRAYRGHLDQHNMVPVVLSVFTDVARMQRVRGRASMVLARAPNRLPLFLFGGPEAATRPLDSVWQRADDDSRISLCDQSLQ